MSKTEKTRNEMLQEWLNENVQVFPTPKKIKLTNFEVLWEHLSGSFNMTLDGVFINERMNFSPEASGKPTLYYPMFHSPLGVPCSYSLIKITWETEYCILKQLKMLLPRFGDGEMCDLNRNKLDDSTLECIKKKVTDPNLVLEFDMSYDFKI
jgi:hypothetical protein